MELGFSFDDLRNWMYCSQEFAVHDLGSDIYLKLWIPLIRPYKVKFGLFKTKTRTAGGLQVQKSLLKVPIQNSKTDKGLPIFKIQNHIVNMMYTPL